MTLAAHLEGPRRIAVRAITLPDPRPGEVRVRVEACAVCATDLRPWERGSRTLGAGLTGHEVAGVVVGTGGGGTVGPPIGERVCVEPNLAVCCGHCERCRAGLPFFCTQRRELPAWGFAEAMIIPGDAAIGIPDAVPTRLAVLAEPLACVVHAIRTSARATAGGGRLDGLEVAVIGAGPLGLLALAALRDAGARRVLVAARHEHQRGAVTRLGGELLGDAPGALAEARPGMVVLAAGGGSDALGEALAAVDVAGEVVVLGLLDEPQSVDARRAVLRGTRVSFSISYGGRGAQSDFAGALAILARDPAAFAFLLSHRFTLEQADAAFELAADRAQASFRVCIETGGDAQAASSARTPGADVPGTPSKRHTGR